MKQYLTVFIVMLLLLSGCSSKNAENPFDPTKTAEALLASDAFTDTLAEVSDQVAVKLYGIDGSTLTDSVVYQSSGASAEEIAVLAFTDDKAAQAAIPLLEQRVKQQITACQDYLPDEVPKLKAAIIEARGNTAILVVAADAAAAQDILNGLN